MNCSANALDVDESSLSFCVYHLNAAFCVPRRYLQNHAPVSLQGEDEEDGPASHLLSKYLIFSGKGPNGYLRP